MLTEWGRERQKQRYKVQRARCRSGMCHPDVVQMRRMLEGAPCPSCGSAGKVTSSLDGFCWGQRRPGYHQVSARCGQCNATGKYPLTGMPVDFIVGRIRKAMEVALLKAMVK